MSQTVSVPGVGDLEFPDGMSQPDMAAAIKKNFPDIHPNPKQERKDAAAVRKVPKEPVDESLGGAAARTLGRIGHGQDEEGHGLAVGLGEAALGAASAIPAGLTGLAAAPFVGAEKAADISRSMTIEPKTRSGKDVATLLTEPIKMGSEVVGDIFAEAGTDMARSVGASPTTQMKIDAAARTAGEAAIPVAAAAAPLPKAAGRLLKADESLPPVPGKDYSPLREFTPEQEARYRRMQGAGYNPTLGQVTREPEQFRYEEHTQQREAGKDLLERKNDQNAALAKNVETKYPADTTPLPDSKVGELVRGSIDAKLLAKKAETRRLYQRAKAAGETKEEVDVSPLLDYLEKNKADITSRAVPELGSIASRLKAMLPKPKAPEPAAPAILDASGKPIAPTKPPPVPEPPKMSIDDLESLYKAASNLTKPLDPPSMRAMGEIKRLINEVTEGKGGDLYKAARKSRLEQGMEFEEQGGVARVVDKASKTDYKVDSSKLWNNIVKGSVEDLKQTLKTLVRDIRPGVKTTLPTDSIAVKALIRKSMESVLEEATKSATKDAKGNPSFSPAAFKRALDTVGQEKLELLWGKQATADMYRIVDDAIELKTAPNRVAGSPTMSNAQMLTDKVFTNRAAFAIEHLASKMGIPGVPGAIRWAREQIVAHADKAFTKANVEEALTPTKASRATTEELAKPVKREIRQIKMGEAKAATRGPAAAALTMDKKDREAAR